MPDGTAPDGATWVGVLDVDEDRPVNGISGPLQDVHVQARVLVRQHGGPLGFVSVPSRPWATLTDRARAAAAISLPDAVQAHANCPDRALAPRREADFAAWTGCPVLFPPSDGSGVTVAIPTRDRTGLLRDCLLAVQQIRYEPLEILVVDNAPSSSDTKDLVEHLALADSRIAYTSEPQPGISAARNHALTVARYDMVAFTDDDVLVDPGWVAAIAAGFASDPDVACVTGFVAPSALDNPFQRYFDSRYPHQLQFAPSRYDLAEHRPPGTLYPFSAGLFGRGANMAVRRSHAEKMGGFDTLLGVGAPCRGGEDLDFFVRVILAGWRICYMPSALIWHRHRENADALRQAVYLYGFGLGAYLSKYMSHRDLRRALVAHATRQGRVHADRMKAASESSQLGVRSGRLAASEARGVIAGALRYQIARRRAGHPQAGTR